MTKQEQKIIDQEIAKTYELYGFEMSFSEFNDVFALGALFGHNLAKINLAEAKENKIEEPKKDITIWEKKTPRKAKRWFSFS